MPAGNVGCTTACRAGLGWPTLTHMVLPLRLAGAVWGHLVGDAVGVPYEFLPPSAIGEVRFGARGTHGQPPGTWSDDGALLLALLGSLLSVGANPTDQGRRCLAWHEQGAYTPDGDGPFDIGNATGQALRRLQRGAAAEQAGLVGKPGTIETAAQAAFVHAWPSL